MCSVVSEEAGKWVPRVSPGGRRRACWHWVFLLISSCSLERLVEAFVPQLGSKLLRAETVQVSSA